MKRHLLHDKANSTFIEVYCDFISLEEFKNENEFKTFVKTHPSCHYELKRTGKDGTVQAYFNRYSHGYWDGIVIGQIDSYNSDPHHDNELRKYYESKEKEQELKEELDFIKKWDENFENSY